MPVPSGSCRSTSTTCGPHQVGAPHAVGHRAGLGDDGHALGAVDDLGDPATDHLVVVDDHHGDGTCLAEALGAATMAS